jgi:hypothetical protein
MATFPSSPAFQAVNFKINTPTQITNTFSGLTRRVSMGVSYYSFTVKYNSLTRYDYGPIAGFVAQRLGPLDSFQILLPELSYSKQGTQSTNLVITTAVADIGADHVPVGNVGTGKYLLRAGDFFKFGYATSWAASTVYAVGNKVNYDNIDYACKTAHTSTSTFDTTKWTVDTTYAKVYMCAVTWTNGTDLYFSGPLVVSIPSGSRIIYNAVPFTVILENGLQQFDVGLGGITQLSLDMKEVWN